MGRQQHANASPTERAIDECRARGWHVIPLEGWQRVGLHWRRKDFGGFADLMGLCRAERRHVAIQVTSRGNHAARVRKITEQPTGDSRGVKAWVKRVDHAAAWLESGGEIVVWSWGRLQKPRPHWKFRETVITLADLDINRGPIQRVL